MQPSLSSRTIRAIQPADNAAMAGVIRQVMTEFGAVGEGYSINDPEVDYLYEAYQSPGKAFFVIDHEQQVKGGAGIAPLKGSNSEICELQKMYLLPSIRGLGLGKQLLTYSLEVARTLGYRQCYLETVKRMEKAQQLYLSFGFKPLSGPLGSTGHYTTDAWYVLDL